MQLHLCSGINICSIFPGISPSITASACIRWHHKNVLDEMEIKYPWPVQEAKFFNIVKMLLSAFLLIHCQNKFGTWPLFVMLNTMQREESSCDITHEFAKFENLCNRNIIKNSVIRACSWRWPDVVAGISVHFSKFAFVLFCYITNQLMAGTLGNSEICFRQQWIFFPSNLNLWDSQETKFNVPLGTSH